LTLVYVDDNNDQATTEQKQKEYHLKRLKELSEESLGQIPQLEEPTLEQKEWVLRRLMGSEKSWETFEK